MQGRIDTLPVERKVLFLVQLLLENSQVILSVLQRFEANKQRIQIKEENKEKDFRQRKSFECPSAVYEFIFSV